jgi:two-component system chemotaxis response regulator CheY
MNQQKRKGRIYVVDDNEVIRRVLRGIIRQDESLELVGEASGGGSALEGIKVLLPDVVCLDVLMPDLDGLSVLATIREKYPAMRVVMVTGQSTSEVVTDARKLGVHAFVVKPFNAAKVLRAIHTALAADPDPVAESAG